MFHNSLVRVYGLRLVALVFVLIAFRSLFFPDEVAAELGYTIENSNGYNEFFAVYFGVWLATAAFAILASYKISEAIFGDLVAMFILAQPLGRFIAVIQYGWPDGPLFVMLFVELIGGLLLLAIRPNKEQNTEKAGN